MRKTFILTVAATLTACTSAPYALRDMGSFHVGGRDVEVTGKPVKEVVFTPGGVPAKVDLNGTYLVESMYVQYFLPANRRGAVPLLLWHGGGLTGVTYDSTPVRPPPCQDRKSTRLNTSHVAISYAVFCLKE